MKKDDLIKQAAKRLAVASDLLNQAWAVQTFEQQKLLETEQASDEIVKLLRNFIKETDEVTVLVVQFLEHTNGKAKR
jgi:hypothetical protein